VHAERVNGRYGTGELQLSEREQVALSTLVDALAHSLRRRLPISLELLEFDLELELGRREDAPTPIRRRRPKERH
jgi:hypothetical protein